MSNECNCENPPGGGITCPPQHIALCIRGKDRQCYGECIPIPEVYSFFSERFNSWAKKVVHEKVHEHVKNHPNIYLDLREFKEMSYSLKKEKSSESLPKGVFKFKNRKNEEISVQYSFSFHDPLKNLPEDIIK